MDKTVQSMNFNENVACLLDEDGYEENKNLCDKRECRIVPTGSHNP